MKTICSSRRKFKLFFVEICWTCSDNTLKTTEYSIARSWASIFDNYLIALRDKNKHGKAIEAFTCY